MDPTPTVVVSLPTADRQRAAAFYREGLGLAFHGELGDDGLPEPLTFTLGPGVLLMFVPTDGFGWVLGGGPVAEPGTSECVLSLDRPTEAEVDALVDQARAAGADVFAEPTSQPWGYSASFRDPDGHAWMVTVAE